MRISQGGLRNVKLLEEAVADLKRQLQAATQTSTPPINRGLPLSQVSQRQQRRKVSTLKTATEKALWFVANTLNYAGRSRSGYSANR